jgi:hypothetical protein
LNVLVQVCVKCGTPRTDPSRIEAISSAGDQRESNEKYRYSHSGLRMAFSMAMERQRSRTIEISGSWRIKSEIGTATSKPAPPT